MTSRLATLLMNRHVDRIVAIVAVAPFAWNHAHKLQHVGLSAMAMPDLLRLLVGLTLVTTMVFRRAPTRVTTKPAYWVLAFLGNYQLFWIPDAFLAGQPLLPLSVLNAVSVAGSLIVLGARVSLGRNIGFVAAQRELVTGGLYRYVRHPIYSGMMLLATAGLLFHFSLSRLAIFAFGMILWVLKSRVEEKFLADDARYARYLKTVRYRWIPGIL